MTETRIQNGYRRKRPDKKQIHEKYLESNHCAKNVLQCRILKASKTDVIVQKYKQLESMYNLMHGLEQVPTGVMQKQINLCISGTNFIVIKTEYISKTKICFSQNF